MKAADTVEQFIVRWMTGEFQPCLEGLSVVKRYFATSPTIAELESIPLLRVSKETLKRKLHVLDELSAHLDICEKCGEMRTLAGPISLSEGI